MSGSRQIDDISKLQGLTMTFSQQVKDIIGKSFIECPKIENYEDISNNPDVQSIDAMVDALIDNFKTFDSTIDSLEEFHKTKDEQLNEIETLSKRNQVVTDELINKINEFDSIQHELGLVLDHTLETLD